MQGITQGSENTQEQQNTTTQKKRGRPARNQIITPLNSVQSTSQLEVTHVNNDNTEELQQLKQQLEQLQQENQKLKQIAGTVTITNTKPLINCTDDEINSLYVNYITQHETNHDNALVIESEGKVIIPKSYYVIS